MYKWGTFLYFLLEKSVAIFLKLAENENFDKIACLPVRGEHQNEKVFFNPLLSLPPSLRQATQSCCCYKDFRFQLGC